jgi:hypothetical protein
MIAKAAEHHEREGCRAKAETILLYWLQKQKTIMIVVEVCIIVLTGMLTTLGKHMYHNFHDGVVEPHYHRINRRFRPFVMPSDDVRNQTDPIMYQKSDSNDKFVRKPFCWWIRIVELLLIAFLLYKAKQYLDRKKIGTSPKEKC